MTFILLVIIIFFLIVVLIDELSSRTVFGKFLSDEELAPFFEKNISKYGVNDSAYKDNRVMMNGKTFEDIHLPYMARPGSFIWNWYIGDFGRIPRWSPFSKKLDAVYENLEKPIIKTLKDL